MWSFVLPARNERGSIEQAVVAIEQWCWPRSESFEILIVLNGCGDGTELAVATLVNEHQSVQVLRSATGLGNAVRTGLAHATGDRVVLTGADLPFGFTDVQQWDGRQLSFGSKAHCDSDIRRTTTRSALSSIFTVIRRAVLPLPVRDAQGSILVPGPMAAYFARSCQEQGYAIGPEIAYLAHRNGWTINELPVVLGAETRSSHVRPLRDGYATVKSLIAIRHRSYPVDPIHHGADTSWSH
jgi:dolichyl-phosphate beta-glucosyltransferase